MRDERPTLATEGGTLSTVVVFCGFANGFETFDGEADEDDMERDRCSVVAWSATTSSSRAASPASQSTHLSGDSGKPSASRFGRKTITRRASGAATRARARGFVGFPDRVTRRRVWPVRPSVRSFVRRNNKIWGNGSRASSKS